MKKLLIVFVTFGLMVFSVACEKSADAEGGDQSTEKAAEKADEEAQPDEGESADEAKEAEKSDQEAEAGEKTAMVEVPADGKEFDPAVEKSRIPDGTWICDMGTVHWASTEKPEDGKCPVCGMMVKKHEHAEADKK